MLRNTRSCKRSLPHWTRIKGNNDCAATDFDAQTGITTHPHFPERAISHNNEKDEEKTDQKAIEICDFPSLPRELISSLVFFFSSF